MKLIYYVFRNKTVTLARFVENVGAHLGGSVRLDPDGSRHPGSVCNAYLKRIAKDLGHRKSYGYEEGCVLQVDSSMPTGSRFIQYLMDQGVLDSSSLKGGMLDVYTPKGAQIVVSAMNNCPTKQVPEYLIEWDFTFKDVELPVSTKTLRKQKDLPKGRTLFKV